MTPICLAGESAQSIRRIWLGLPVAGEAGLSRTLTAMRCASRRVRSHLAAALRALAVVERNHRNQDFR